MRQQCCLIATSAIATQQARSLRNKRDHDATSAIATQQVSPESFSQSQSSDSKTYSDFIKTLSEEERANFLNFCQEKTKNLSQEVNDIEAWLAHKNKAGQNRWEIYYEKYLASKQAQAEKTKTQVAPRNALDEFRRELEEQQRQAQRAWEESQSQNHENNGGAM